MIVERSESAERGLTAQPQGEEIARYTDIVGEANRAMLANSPLTGASVTHPVTRRDISSADSLLSTIPELNSGNGVEQAPAGECSVVRATCRIQIDLAMVADDKDAHIKRRCGGSNPGVEPCKACVLREQLRHARNDAVRAANAVMRMHWRADADVLDRARVKLGRAPKGADEWKQYHDPHALVRAVLPGLPEGAEKGLKVLSDSGNLYTYAMARLVAPALSSGCASTIAREVAAKWQQSRFECLIRQSMTPPHYRESMPLPIRAADVQFSHVEGDLFRIRFGVLAGKNMSWAIPIKARDSYMRQVLRELTDGQTRMGAVRVQEDRLRPGRWYLRISYTRKVNKIAPAEKIVAVHPGIVTFLCALGSDGDRWLYDGKDIEAYLRQVQRRRQQYQRDSKGSARWGHGLGRTLAPIRKLEDAGERWRDTKIQTLGRRLATWIRDRGYTLVLMPDFSGIRDGLPEKLKGGKRVWDRVQTWPWYRQQQALTSCLEEYGIQVKMQESPHKADTCPKCEHSDNANIHLKRRLFICSECGYRKMLDIVFCENSLACERSGGGELDHEENGRPGNGKKGPLAKRRASPRKAKGNGRSPGNGKNSG